MERQIEKVEFDKTQIKRYKVAAYCRVSSGKDAMLHSLAAQVSHFKEEIRKHSDWDFVEVYTDEAITGTKEDRDNFQRMVDDAFQGKIDLILAKSVSRFARNTVTLLSTIRSLKDKGVGIFFEEEGINTLSSEGELLITVLASYAQDESRSVSENMKWRIKKNFEEGIPWGARLYGYSVKNNTFTIIPNEAQVVKMIFSLYLEGNGFNKISRILNSLGYKTRDGNDWCNSSVKIILSNEYYTGDMVLQKTFRENHITKKTLINNGELPKYHVEGHHDAIIGKEDFAKAQIKIAKAKKDYSKKTNDNVYPFSGKLICAICGKHYRRKVREYGGIMWQCTTYDHKGKEYCSNHGIREDILIECCCKALKMKAFDEKAFEKEVHFIKVNNDNNIEFFFYDKEPKLIHWVQKSRKESWTPEMKEKARQKALDYLKEAKNNG